LPFAVRDMVVGAVFCAFLALHALKVVHRKPRYDLPDILLAILLFYLATVFIRNPVGTLAMNSYRVGGKPYFNVAIACLAYWIITPAAFPPRAANAAIFLQVLGKSAVAAINIVADLFPRSVPVLANFYSDIAAANEYNQNSGPVQTT